MGTHFAVGGRIKVAEAAEELFRVGPVVQLEQSLQQSEFLIVLCLPTRVNKYGQSIEQILTNNDSE